MYYFEIDWTSKTYGHSDDEIVVDEGKIPVHIPVDDREEAIVAALKIAQGVARAYMDTFLK